MRLVLPQDVVDELELRYMGSAYVAGADGPARAAAAGRAGHGPDRRRSTTTDCLVGPAGSQAVVGHVVLAMRDLVADEAGIAAGLLATLLASRALVSLLFEVSPTDLTTLAGVSLVLLLVAAAAAGVPARRAARVDPLAALRIE